MKSYSEDKILIALLGLSSIKGLGMESLKKLYDIEFLKDYGEASKNKLNNAFDKLNIPDKGDIAKKAYQNRKKILSEGKDYSTLVENSDIEFVTNKNKIFPPKLFDIKDTPRWIFYKGNIDLAHQNNIISIIGTRSCSPTGKSLAHWVSKNLSTAGYVVMSGLAKGIDQVAHVSASKYYAANIAVLGHGMIGDYKSYDTELEKSILEYDGLVLSEYFPEQYPQKSFFLRRNELVAALSDLVIPIETPSLKSGTGATIRRALRLNRRLLGINPIFSDEPQMKETVKSLRSVDIDTIDIHQKDSTLLLEEVKKYVSDNTSKINSHTARKERFFKKIAGKVSELNRDNLKSSNDIKDLNQYLSDFLQNRIKQND